MNYDDIKLAERRTTVTITIEKYEELLSIQKQLAELKAKLRELSE